MKLTSKFINEELSSIFCLSESCFGFIESFLEFGYFLNTDILHFFIVLLKSL